MGNVSTIAELESFCTKNKIEGVLTSNVDIILRLCGKDKASLANYAGSVFRIANGTIKVLCINPLEHFVSVRYGDFLAQRYIAKLLKPETFIKQTALTWEVCDAGNFDSIYARFSSALYIAADIETSKTGLAIDIAGYCALFADGSTHSITISIKSIYELLLAQKFNELPAAKIFQNGGYDNAYFLRWGIPPVNYLWDTLHLFHSWYSEMPKSLDFLTSFLLPEFQYWKDESGGTTFDRLFYNAKDTWATMNCFLALIREMPQWAKNNYLKEFPLVYPALNCSMEGIAIDPEVRDKLAVCENAKLDKALGSIRRSLNMPEFNPSSPPQVKKLMHVLGCKDIPTSGVKDMKKAADRHPLNAWFINNIISYRKARKLISSYLDAELLNGRYLYSLNPAGTDTGRLASGESQFWCGNQIQNIARAIKSMFMADEGWLLTECDKSQSEDRCVAVLSGDKGLLGIYATDKDSHSVKAAMFFGLAYEEILRIEKEAKASNSNELTIRDLAKRVNHGSNYNMGAYVLLETMGISNVQRARDLLGVSKGTPLLKVCEGLLAVYEKAFPMVKTRWYNQIKLEVATTKKLVGATGWTRYCFGNPAKSKPELNAYVAHVPQSLSVMIVNKELMNVFRWSLDHADVFRMKAQIHDSIFFQYRIGAEWVVDKVNSMMQTSIMVKGSDGNVRPLCIPTDVKSGLTHWGK
jgi:DNA polymerase I-like protein with 3'-5' exonuclease and polymerase domains